MSEHFPPGLPPDPFADDPDDPAAELAAPDDEALPLDEAERREVEQDLADLTVFERMLSRKGVRGLAIWCEDCREEHYHDWGMVRAGLLQLLADGSALPHEPAFSPDPEDYATWDYCRGYADAVLHSAPWPTVEDDHRA